MERWAGNVIHQAFRRIRGPLAAVAAASLVAGVAGVVGAASSSATAIPPATANCTYTDSATSQSSSSILTGVSAGDTISVSCTGVTLAGTTPYTGPVAVLAEASPLAVVSSTGNQAIYADQTHLGTGSVPTAGSVTASFVVHATGNTTDPFTPASTDPNATCPPTQAEINAGLVGCAVAVADLIKQVGIDTVIIVFKGTTAPNAPTVSTSPIQGTPPVTLTATDNGCATPVTATSTCWYGSGTTATSSTAKPATITAAVGGTTATSALSISPAIYCDTGGKATPPAACTGLTLPALIGPHLTGTITTPSTLPAGANTVEVDQANLTPFPGKGTLPDIVSGSANVAATTSFGALPPPVSITTTSLPGGTVGTAYSATLAATGGTTPYTWAATGLPAGLSLNTSTGAITGTPTTAGTSTVSVTVTDSTTPTHETATKSLSITIAPASVPLSITTTSLPGGTVGTAYSATLAATGGTTPYTWAATGLPTGLSLDTSTGAITGTPMTSSTFSVSVTVTDSTTPTHGTATKALPITIAPASVPVSITTTSLPGGTVGSAYSATLAATGGTTPYTWAATGLPTGLSLDTSTGAITGTPTTAGTSTVNVMVTDSTTPTAGTATKSLSITIASTSAPVSITTTSLPGGTVGSAYSATLAATGGTTPYAWAATGLPAGLSLDTSTGAITGTPTTAGTSTVSVTVTDSTTPTHETASASLSLKVAPAALVITNTTALPLGLVGGAYSATLAATGGTTPYTWAATGLPAGLSLDTSTGAITGTPTTAGTSTVTVTVTDATTPAALTATTPLSLTVVPVLSITTASLPDGAVGNPYNEAVSATGGLLPIVWSATGLPAGLSLNTSTGVISGIPTTAGTFSSVTVQAEDTFSPTPQKASQTLTITILPAAAPSAPIDVTADGGSGDGSVFVQWVPPVDTGSSPLTSYTITAKPGGATTTVTATNPPPAVVASNVTGLTDGVAYTFTVTATNNAGPGPSSMPSNPAVPVALSPAACAPSAPPSTCGNLTVSGAIGEGLVLLGSYSGNPLPTDLPGGQAFYDVKMFSVNFISLTVTVCSTNQGDSIVWWNPTQSAWEPATEQSSSSSEAGCIDVQIDPSTGPAISQMYGTVFAVVAPAPPTGGGISTAFNGYDLAGMDGGVFAYGDAQFFGSLPGLGVKPAAPVLGIATTSDAGGYWLVSADGGVYAFGDATFFGSLPGLHVKPDAPIMGIVATSDDGGYWLVGADGGVYAFGDATFFGSLAGHAKLTAPVMGIAPTSDDGGYWLVAADGGIFSFGDAGFFGSMAGKPLSAAIHGIEATSDDGGYWLVGGDGGVYAFGDAPFFGSIPGLGGVPAGVASAISSGDPGGYWVFTSGGGVVPFGDAQFFGSATSLKLNAPIWGATRA